MPVKSFTPWHCICCSVCRSPQDLEEGEIRAADEDMKQTEACYSSLNLALYEMLSGNSSQAVQAIQAALHRHEGNLHVSCKACHLQGTLHYCHVLIVYDPRHHSHLLQQRHVHAGTPPHRHCFVKTYLRYVQLEACPGLSCCMTVVMATLASAACCGHRPRPVPVAAPKPPVEGVPVLGLRGPVPNKQVCW